ncbi:unnamed protein product, partial [Heterosigma akashiwo]
GAGGGHGGHRGAGHLLHRRLPGPGPGGPRAGPVPRRGGARDLARRRGRAPRGQPGGDRGGRAQPHAVPADRGGGGGGDGRADHAPPGAGVERPGLVT